jgi:hypothetical protein
MRYFCTYFDINYLDRGIALYRSLEQHVPEFTLFVLCMDIHVEKALSKLDFKNVTPISLAELESNDPALLVAKNTRSRIEYYFTCTPCLPIFILKNRHGIDLITYLDADLFFFNSPEPLFQEMGGCSIAIISHRFPPNLKHFEQHGIFNVSWLSFRNDFAGFKCLEWWREKCLEWCYDRVEDGKFADQKYLDDWPQRFQGTKILQHQGANVAAWNLGDCDCSCNNDKISVNGAELIFFHFHGLKRIFHRVYDPNFRPYGLRLSEMPLVRTLIFEPYIATLKISTDLIKGVNRTQQIGVGAAARYNFSRNAKDVIVGILNRQLVIF